MRWQYYNIPLAKWWDDSIIIYPLLNDHHLIAPFCSLSKTYTLFIPSTVKDCHKLNTWILKLDLLSKFKTALHLKNPIKQEVSSLALLLWP